MATPKDVHSPLLTPTTKISQPPGVLKTPTTDKKDFSKAKMPPTLTPVDTMPRKADTNLSWGTPLGLGVRGANDENLIIFRKALGINWKKNNADGATLEEGRKTATGIYKCVISAQERKHTQHTALTALLYVLYFSQVVLGAALTALGPTASDHAIAITLLGAINTVIAGVLALIKGSGQPQRLGKDQVGYRKLQDWIEETEALLAVGVIGRDRREVGLLVEVAFKKYNAAKASEENNRPDMYINQPMESLGNRTSAESLQGGRMGKDGKENENGKPK